MVDSIADIQQTVPTECPFDYYTSAAPGILRLAQGTLADALRASVLTSRQL